MAMVRWEPFRDLLTIQDRMNRGASAAGQRRPPAEAPEPGPRPDSGNRPTGSYPARPNLPIRRQNR
jgi:hypothetical protein